MNSPNGWLPLVLVCLLGFTAGCASRSGPEGQTQADRSPPNIIVVMADDLGYGDISPYGGWIDTPNLERLAREGMRFTDFHAGAPVCSPTRASLLTGRYQQRAGLSGVIYASRERNRHHGLQRKEFTFAELAKQAGYATGVFGKWHLGYQETYNPTYQGFDEFRGYVSGNVDYISHADGIGVHDWWNENKKVREKGYVTHLINKHAADFVRRHQNEPFLLYVAQEAPHWPYQGPDDKPIRKVGGERTRTAPRRVGDTTYIKTRYRQMVTALDEGVGQLVNVLEELGLAENTLVLFISDNGPLPFGSAGELRGWKKSVLEGGHRVPAIAWWPGQIPAGSRTDQLAITLDVFPTIAELIGAEPPTNRTLDGRSLVPVLLEGKRLDRRQLFWDYVGQQAMRDGPWKLVKHPIVAGQGQQKSVALYNLEKDIGESNDLSDRYPEQTEKMQEALKRWKKNVEQTATPQPTKK